MKTPQPIPQLSDSDKARFWSKVNKNGPVPPHCPELGPCWVWQGSRRGKDGYGQFSVRGRCNLSVHRVAWAMDYGDPGPSVLVLHKCDNKICARSAHLFLGSYTDNVRDMMDKGRDRFPILPHIQGEDQACSKLTANEVLEIRKRYAEEPTSMAEMAVKFGVSRVVINRIVQGRGWKHLGGPRSRGIQAHRLKTKRGEENGRARLTEAEVKAMRARFSAGGISKAQLARDFNCGESSVRDIVRRKTWKHI